ncbi:hypothetical protein B7494_g7838 [Chlorociboria aeruginascens]|nr:hypothetical protein B7494_g7838 [Chlorociboria aeruginascens]
MATSFLDKLPREIHDHIYEYVLAPSGHAIYGYTLLSRGVFLPHGYLQGNQIFPEWPHEAPYTEPINLGLIRTCRQIHGESKDVFWQKNAIHLSTTATFVNRLPKSPEFSRLVAQHVQHVQLDINLDQPAQVQFLNHSLVRLSDWSRRGDLRTVILNIPVGISLFEMYLRSTRGREVGFSRASLEVLKPALAQLSTVERKLYLGTGFSGLSIESQQAFLAEFSTESAQYILDLNQIFGGDLFVDGFMCYKNGVWIQNGFELRKVNQAIRL